MTYGFCSAWCTNSIQFRNDVMFCSCVLTPDLIVQLYPHDVLSNCICHLASAFPSLATFFTMYVFFQSFKIGDRCMDIKIFFLASNINRCLSVWLFCTRLHLFESALLLTYLTSLFTYIDRSSWSTPICSWTRPLM